MLNSISRRRYVKIKHASFLKRKTMKKRIYREHVHDKWHEATEWELLDSELFFDKPLQAV